jgi:hypothetical protein
MSRSTVNILRKFPPQEDIDLGNTSILINDGEPRTPQVARQALKEIQPQLSSPASNYTLESMPPNQGSSTLTYSMRHQFSDRERLTVSLFLSTSLQFAHRLSNLKRAKGAFSEMERRMSALEKAVDAERKEIRQERERLKKQEETVLRWEICDRLAQGIPHPYIFSNG